MTNQAPQILKKRVRPRILVLTTCYPSDESDPSGIFIAKLLQAIKRRGYEINVVAPSNGAFYGTRTVNSIETCRFGYFRPRSLERLTAKAGGIPENMSRSLFAKIQVVPLMAAFLWTALRKSRRCDLVYANWIGAGIIGAVLNLLTGKPLVVTFRGDDGYLAKQRRLWRVLTKWVTNRSSVVAPVSRELGEIMLELGMPARKCHVPQFGVDMEMFFPDYERTREREEIRLLFVGSLIMRKGLHDLMQALSDPIFKNVKLVVVGEGTYAQELKTLCERLGLPENTEWKGLLAPADVANEMRNADILCLPSYMEGRPNVVNEAMASGLPVISTRIGGIPDMVVEGKTALLFDAGNIEQLKACLDRLISDKNLRMEMGTAGRDFLIRSGVSWEGTAEEFDDLMSDVLRNHVGFRTTMRK